ncbi:hypothetical protein CEXT_256271 [Caerostris extrusa]|uniref:Uncharacterized protein n=1 Tax=Caerostris extrusa TaxID=172846 RepID=A0AAV4P8Q1_CAEEX|nr:hypothetical protein CEXT_256271 [Caerostris extrusa]
MSYRNSMPTILHHQRPTGQLADTLAVGTACFRARDAADSPCSSEFGASRVIQTLLALNVNHPRCHGSHDARRRFELHPEKFLFVGTFRLIPKRPTWRGCE